MGARYSIFTFMLVLVSTSLQATSYFEQYRSCLVDHCPASASERCTRFANELGRGYARLSRSLTALAPSIPCQSGGEVFMGNGVRVDSATCGARPASESCPDSVAMVTFAAEEKAPVQSNACQGLNGRNVTSASASTLRHWDTSCIEFRGGESSSASSSSGCEQCGSRPSIVQRVADNFKTGVGKLLSCFAPKGPYPHSRLYATILAKLSDLQANGGLLLRCPDDDLARQQSTGHHPSASANASNRSIDIFHRSLASSNTPSIMAHEFMHLMQNDAHPIDNEDTHTHNHPYHHHAHQASSGGTDYNPATANPDGATNEMMDRVYSCQGLCFADENMISKEQCQLCLKYRTPTLPSSLSKKCNAMITRSDLVDLNNQLIVSESDINNMCNNQYDLMASAFQEHIRTRRVERSGSTISFGNSEHREEFGIYMSLREGGDGFMSLWGVEPAPGLNSDSDVGREHPRRQLEASISAEIPSSSTGPAFVPRYSAASNPTFSEIKSRCGAAYNDLNSKIQTLLERYPNDSRNRNALIRKQVQYGFGAKEFVMKRLCDKIRVFGLMQTKCGELSAEAGRYSTETRALGRQMCTRMNEASNGQLYRESLRPHLAELKRNALAYNCMRQQMSTNTTYSGATLPDALTVPGSAASCDDVEDSSPDVVFRVAEARTFCDTYHAR